MDGLAVIQLAGLIVAIGGVCFAAMVWLIERPARKRRK
jgi:hypothetical protein